MYQSLESEVSEDKRIESLYGLNPVWVRSSTTAHPFEWTSLVRLNGRHAI